MRKICMCEKDLRDLIRAVNEVIEVSINYGGDAGGPYCEDPVEFKQYLLDMRPRLFPKADWNNIDVVTYPYDKFKYIYRK